MPAAGSIEPGNATSLMVNPQNSVAEHCLRDVTRR
jgi:hypothetical protein